MKCISFDAVNQAALTGYPDLLFQWLPGGRLEGSEYVCADINGGKGNSFKVNIKTGKWSDFAESGMKGGDPVSLYAAINGLQQHAAALELSAKYSIANHNSAPYHNSPPTPPNAPLPPSSTVSPAPPDAPAPSCIHSKHGEPSQVWCYRDAVGRVLHYVARYDKGDGEKTFSPWTWNGSEWIPKGPPSPRPLYGLDRLAKNPDAPVIVCEGEKPADAAQRMCGEKAVGVSWSGGSNAVAKSDWSPLFGRRVVIWPDADEAGAKARDEIIEKLRGVGAAEIIGINVSDKPEKWDAADAEAEGWGKAEIKEFFATNRLVDPTEKPLPNFTSDPDCDPAEHVGIRSPEFSDDSLALEFAARHESNLRHVAAWGKWLLWHSTRWAIDETLRMYDLARAILREAAVNAPKPGTAKALASAKTVHAISSLARADRRIAATSDQWDADPWLLNTPAGIVDLRDGHIQPHRQSAYMTKITAVGPGGECPMWEAFLERVTGGDKAFCLFLQRICGYALTGITRDHALFFLYGTGANGKSVFQNTVANVMGDYAMAAPMDTFIVSNNDRHPTDLAGLRGARLVFAAETEEGRRWSESRIKQLTGGDPISARFMRQDFFTFRPQFKLIIAGNHKPGLRNVDEAMRRRFNLLPFTVTIPPEDQDKHLTEKLEAEWPGILQWMIDGALEWQRIGLSPPEAVRAATEAYLENEDAVAQWISDCCTTGPNDWDSSASLYQSWKVWADKAGEYQGSHKRFTKNLEDRGFLRSRAGKGKRGHRGIAVIPPANKEAFWDQ